MDETETKAGIRHRSSFQPTDPQRLAAVTEALAGIDDEMTIGLGSGRAVFALAAAIGERWSTSDRAPVRAVVASSLTEACARQAGIEIVPLSPGVAIDIAFDGADEVDDQLRLVKGGGAALLQEKIVIAHADRVVIIAEACKLSTRLGERSRLPIEIVRFGWETTCERIEELGTDVRRRTSEETGEPVITDEGHFLVDASIPDDDIATFAARLKATLGVVEHGLFLDQADRVVLGHTDGSVSVLDR